MGFERRKQRRVQGRRKVGIVLHDGTVYYAWTHDFSTGGLQLRSGASADVGQRFVLFLHIFDPRRHGYVQVKVRAEVAHVHLFAGSDDYAIGMKFLEFLNNTQELYERYVNDCLQTMTVAVG